MRSPMEHYAQSGHSSAMTGNGIAAALQSAKNPLESLRFPAEDGGQSLAAWARRDLEATLQLLADRAQYITGGTGAAIALRDGDFIMCRASSGPSAPQIGSCFEVSSGLSGESVRTRKMLRCDDASTDPRVNYESCKALGIASFAVMPLIRQDEVIGIFEVFSNKPRAFQERDLLALERMGEMVNTALDQVKSPKAKMAPLGRHAATVQPPEAFPESAGSSTTPEENLLPGTPTTGMPQGALPETVVQDALQLDDALLFGTSAEVEVPQAQTALTAISGIGTCTACGFPVSGGRKLCLDCEAAKQQPAQDTSSEAPAFLAGLEAEKTGFKHWIISHRYLLGTIAMAAATVLVLLLHR
jgi:GAF domain-containing protein